MTVAVAILPKQQLAALNAAYRQAVARKRLRLLLGAVVFAAALVLAAIGAEVNLRTFFTYFGKVVFTGSHENAMLALAQGTVDVAANQWTSDDDSTLAQMLTKGMLKNADGTPMKKDDFRIIHKSAPIINGPYAYNSDLPDDLKAAIAKAFTESPTKDKVAFDRLSDGQKKGFHPATTKDWDGTIELIKFVDNLRKKKAS